MPRPDPAPGWPRVDRHVRPPSEEIRTTGFVPHAAPGPRWTYTTATRFGSVGWGATTGSQARSLTDSGTRLTAASWATTANTPWAGATLGAGDGLVVGSVAGGAPGDWSEGGCAEATTDGPAPLAPIGDAEAGVPEAASHAETTARTAIAAANPRAARAPGNCRVTVAR